MHVRWLMISLRLFAETGDPAVVKGIADAVASRVGNLGGVHTRLLERYWKVPEYYEVGIALRPDGDAFAAVEVLLAELATGWDRHGSGSKMWATWNPFEQSYCFSSLVRWMSLELNWMGIDARFDFDDTVVIIGNTPGLSEIRGEFGVVVGRACGGEGLWSYAVRINRTGHCWSCVEDDLQPVHDLNRPPGAE